MKSPFPRSKDAEMFDSIRFSRFLMSLFLLGSTALFAEEAAETPASPQKYLFRYKFEPGQFVKFHVNDRSAFKSRKDAYEESVKNQTEQWRQYRVIEINEEGVATLEFKIDRARMTAQFDEAPPTVFDSADPNQQPKKLASIMNSVGVPLCRMKVDLRGELTDVHSLRGQTIENDPAINMLVVFPEEEIAIGDDWKQTLEVEVPISKTLKETVKLQRKYTFDRVEGNVATFKIATTLISIVRDPGMQTRLLTQTPSGEVKFDLERGVLLSRELKVEDQVVGAFGSGTLFRASTHRIESLIEEEATAEATTSVSQK